MVETSPPANYNNSSQIIPLPYALYDSNGLLFELYQGGQPVRRREVKWTRLGHQSSQEQDGQGRGQDNGQV
jgi:hypothetical protein